MSAKSVTSVLLVEDNPGDACLLREMLRESASLKTQLTHCLCMDDAGKHLASNEPNVIFLDLGLSDATGLDAVRKMRAVAPDIPLVVLTGLDDKSLAAQALEEGAQDYLVKGQIEARGLIRAVHYAIQRKAMELASVLEKERITHSAQHDFLTGLPNRMLLNDRVKQAIALAPRHKKKVALLFLDLDGFKSINDSMGHSTGDKLLESIANRLVDCVRCSDTVSRQGGDEFVVLLSEVEQSEDAAITARRMLRAVAEIHFIDQRNLHVTTSIGVSVYPDDGLDAETLVKNADTAMYYAKEHGRQSYQFFDPAMNGRTVERPIYQESLERIRT